MTATFYLNKVTLLDGSGKSIPICPCLTGLQITTVGDTYSQCQREAMVIFKRVHIKHHPEDNLEYDFHIHPTSIIG